MLKDYKIIPCKVCQSNLIWFESDDDAGVDGYCVNCGNGVFGYETLDKAVDSWNDRNKES